MKVPEDLDNFSRRPPAKEAFSDGDMETGCSGDIFFPYSRLWTMFDRGFTFLVLGAAVKPSDGLENFRMWLLIALELSESGWPSSANASLVIATGFFKVLYLSLLLSFLGRSERLEHAHGLKVAEPLLLALSQAFDIFDSPLA